MTIPLVSKKVLYTFTNIQDGDDRFDKILEMFAVTASAMVEDYLRRSLGVVEVVQYARSHEYSPVTGSLSGDEQIVYLDMFPVATDKPFVVGYSPVREWDSTTLVELQDYVLDSSKGMTIS